MRALTLTQPWASLVAVGAKRIETRSWQTSYRGPLAIHAAKGLDGIRPGATDDDLGELCARFDAALLAGGIELLRDDLPRGAIVATCVLADVRHLEQLADVMELTGGGPEFEYGDYTLGRYAWILDDVRPVDPPRPARGKRGLWTVT